MTVSRSQPSNASDLVERLRSWDHGHKTMIVSETIDRIEELEGALRACLDCAQSINEEQTAAFARAETALQPKAGS